MDFQLLEFEFLIFTSKLLAYEERKLTGCYVKALYIQSYIPSTP